MRNYLRYLMIIQPGGIPLFAQSFNFPTDFECQTFNERLVGVEINPILLGGLFEALQNLFSELIKDNMRLIDIGFRSYRVSGLIFDRLLYLGIFDITNLNYASQTDFFPYLVEISSKFRLTYPSVLAQSDHFDYSRFDGFANDLIELGYAVEYQDCRNCLTKCKDENKQCVPHLYYFKEVQAKS